MFIRLINKVLQIYKKAKEGLNIKDYLNNRLVPNSFNFIFVYSNFITASIIFKKFNTFLKKRLYQFNI